MQLIATARTKPSDVAEVTFAVNVLPVSVNPEPTTMLANPPDPLPRSIAVPEVAGAKLPVDVGARLTQCVPLLVSTLFAVPGATIVTVPVLLPTITLPSVRFALPVPPLGTASGLSIVTLDALNSVI